MDRAGQNIKPGVRVFHEFGDGTPCVVDRMDEEQDDMAILMHPDGDEEWAPAGFLIAEPKR